MTVRRFGILIVGCIILFHSASLALASHYFQSRVRARIEQQVGTAMTKEGFVCLGEPICGVQLIPSFYAERNYQPVWFGHNGLGPSAPILIRMAEEAYKHGLRPTDYHINTIKQVYSQLAHEPFPPLEDKAAAWADLDLLLTDAFLLLAAHLSGGRINPETLHPDWIIGERSMDLRNALESVTGDETMIEAVNQLQPMHAGYLGLRMALAHLRNVAASGGWPRVKMTRTIRPSDVHEQVINLRHRLAISGDYAEHRAPASPVEYDQELVAAVKTFQKRHGLEPDGIIGRKTRAALNISVKQRIRQIELNLERWRWLPSSLGDRYIVVNTADFRLRVVENGNTRFSMPVVVGRPARKTPVFSATMSYMVFNPYWNVPHTIAVTDILPKLMEGVDYLSHQGIQVFSDWSEDAPEIDPNLVDWSSYGKSNFPFRLRQDPGEKNALGRIKFIFPNKFAVYLHDTPQRSLFRRVQRDFSSGCIRVENARLLASYLLADDERWSSEHLQTALDSGERQVVRVPKPIRVHLLYMTAWVDDDGWLHFREDIYNRDDDLDAALMKRNPYQPPGLTETAFKVHLSKG